MLESGRVWPGGNVEEEVEEEGTGVGGGSDSDLHALLVKAWEAKVFPVIQRRFRNDQERKSGLEQIRGALQLGEYQILSWIYVWELSDAMGICFVTYL